MPISRSFTRRYADLKVLYDLDFTPRQTIIRQRVYKAQNGIAETPITPLLQARVVNDSCPAPRARPFIPRRFFAQLVNPATITGVSEYQALSPYRPTDPNLKAHGVEVAATAAIAIRYQGETHQQSVSPYLQ
ncbi:MAG: hypothetical protein ACFB0C_24270 [Leptolyngbyaceae cyanobacterium]